MKSGWRSFPTVRLFQLTLFFFLIVAARAADTKTAILDAVEPLYVSPTNGLGSWIWASNTFDRQTCLLWNSFEIPESSTVTNARLVMTVDNEFTLYLDGRELGRGAEWRELFVFDLTRLLKPGKHVLAVNCYNGSFFAGMLFGLQINLSNGKTIEIKSDPSWRIVSDEGTQWHKMTEAAADWPAASIKAPLGGDPWWKQPENINVMPSLQPVQIAFWQSGGFQAALIVICILVILISLRLMAQLAMHRKERWLLQQERARIAREIHDDIGARMTQLVLHGELAQSGLSSGSEQQLQMVQMCDEARKLLATMDEILWAVNPRRDTLRDFTAYVCNYAQEYLKHTPIQCLFKIDPEMLAATFNLPFRRSLLMAIKETLNNAVKYSEATELCLQIQWHDQRLIVIVQDNGKGFDPAVIKSERHGMTNMAERMKELGGSCRVTSKPGEGCSIEFNVPLRPPRRSWWSRLWNLNPFAGGATEINNVRSDGASPNYDPTKY